MGDDLLEKGREIQERLWPEMRGGTGQRALTTPSL